MLTDGHNQLVAPAQGVIIKGLEVMQKSVTFEIIQFLGHVRM